MIQGCTSGSAFSIRSSKKFEILESICYGVSIVPEGAGENLTYPDFKYEQYLNFIKSKLI
jgi:hypothetical protein